MGACDFQTTAAGKDAQEAFSNAARQASYEDGHGGYTGTIAEKHDFRVFPKPKAMKVSRVLELAMASYDYEMATEAVKEGYADKWQKKAARTDPLKWIDAKKAASIRQMGRIAYGDKWGPAVALELSGDDLAKAKKSMGLKGTRQKVFVFFGMASS